MDQSKNAVSCPAPRTGRGGSVIGHCSAMTGECNLLRCPPNTDSPSWPWNFNPYLISNVSGARPDAIATVLILLMIFSRATLTASSKAEKGAIARTLPSGAPMAPTRPRRTSPRCYHQSLRRSSLPLGGAQRRAWTRHQRAQSPSRLERTRQPTSTDAVLRVRSGWNISKNAV